MKIYKSNYGFTILNNIAYFFCDDLKEEENTVLFDSKIIKKCNYASEPTNVPNSHASYSGSNKSNHEEDKNIDYYLFSGMDFENNWKLFFDINFKLDHLPSKFFSLKIVGNKKKENNNTLGRTKYSRIIPNYQYNIKNYNKYQMKPSFRNYYKQDNASYYRELYPGNKNNKFNQINTLTNQITVMPSSSNSLFSQPSLGNIKEEIMFGE